MSLNYTIRQEFPADYSEVENVVREAFWNVYSPGCSDHYLVHLMRDCPAFVPELDLVAELNGKIIGHVVNLRSYIAGDDGRRYEVLSLGPIAVLPEYQRMGIGAALIAKVKEIAGRMGFRAILLCGNPAFYTLQGFIAAEWYKIRNSENMYADALHVCGLYKNALDGIAGLYYEDEIYNVDEKEAREFDKHFPYKEAIEGMPSQLYFLEMVERCRPASLFSVEKRGNSNGEKDLEHAMKRFPGSGEKNALLGVDDPS